MSLSRTFQDSVPDLSLHPVCDEGGHPMAVCGEDPAVQQTLDPPWPAGPQQLAIRHARGVSTPSPELRPEPEVPFDTIL